MERLHLSKNDSLADGYFRPLSGWTVTGRSCSTKSGMENRMEDKTKHESTETDTADGSHARRRAAKADPSLVKAPRAQAGIAGNGHFDL